MLHLEDAIHHELEAQGWATAGDIAASLEDRTDVVEARLEQLRRRGRVECRSEDVRVVWSLSK